MLSYGKCATSLFGHETSPHATPQVMTWKAMFRRVLYTPAYVFGGAWEVLYSKVRCELIRSTANLLRDEMAGCSQCN